jgi:hypothetical protein
LASVRPHLAHTDSVFSPSQATPDWRNLLAFCGNPVTKVTEKKSKVTGVTAALEAGINPHVVSQAGRWNTQDVILRYKKNSLAYK